jgi:hypothetical protein
MARARLLQACASERPQSASLRTRRRSSEDTSTVKRTARRSQSLSGSPSRQPPAISQGERRLFTSEIWPSRKGNMSS